LPIQFCFRRPATRGECSQRCDPAAGRGFTHGLKSPGEGHAALRVRRFHRQGRTDAIQDSGPPGKSDPARSGRR
jgi:hypothetical protein